MESIASANAGSPTHVCQVYVYCFPANLSLPFNLSSVITVTTPAGVPMMAGLAAQEGQFVSHESLLETRKRKRDSSSVAATRSGGTYERRKAVKACLVCRARKTKCDNVRPICGFCKSTGGECRYSSDNSSRRASVEYLC